MDSAVAVPAIDSERSISAASVRTRLVASVDAPASVLWASRAEATMDSAVAVPAVESECCMSAASVRTRLAASVDAPASVL